MAVFKSDLAADSPRLFNFFGFVFFQMIELMFVAVMIGNIRLNRFFNFCLATLINKEKNVGKGKGR